MSTEENMDVSSTENIAETVPEPESTSEVSKENRFVLNVYFGPKELTNNNNICELYSNRLWDFQQNPQEVEKLEEEKLKAKFPQAMGGGLGRPGGHSAFLQKRLQKGQKYFDSGDYQMAKQKPGGGGGGLAKQIFANKVTTGEGN